MVKKIKEVEKEVTGTVVAEVSAPQLGTFAESLDGEVVQPGVYDNDIPFAKPRIGLEGRRKYNRDPKHEAVVEIAGKNYELTDVDINKVKPYGIELPWDPSVDILNNYRHGGRSRAGRWGGHDSLTVAELKFKHVRIGGIDIFISNGSELIVSNSFGYNDVYDPVHMESIARIPSVMVILASKVVCDSVMLSGTNIIRNSLLTSQSYITLVDAHITESGIESQDADITFDDSRVTGCSLRATKSISVIDTNIYNARIAQGKTISLERVTGGNKFIIDGIGYEPKFNIRIDNQYLYAFNYSGRFFNSTDSLKGYEPADAAGHWNTSDSLTIESRVDYGVFSGIVPISFVRLNQHDLLVAGKVFSVQDFFPELIVKKEPPKIGEEGFRPSPFGMYPASPYATPSPYFVRGSDVWNKAVAIAFDKEKAVIGKLGESIVNSLLEQIRSRINLYIEISTIK